MCLCLTISNITAAMLSAHTSFAMFLSLMLTVFLTTSKFNIASYHHTVAPWNTWIFHSHRNRPLSSWKMSLCSRCRVMFCSCLECSGHQKHVGLLSASSCGRETKAAVVLFSRVFSLTKECVQIHTLEVAHTLAEPYLRYTAWLEKKRQSGPCEKVDQWDDSVPFPWWDR